VDVDVEALYAKLQEGATTQVPVWQEVLSPVTMGKLREVLALERATFEFPTALWSQALFDVAVAYRDRILPKVQLLDSLAPLYFGRTLSFVRATEGMALAQAEEYVEEQCQAFEESKPYLLERWGG